MKYVIKDLESSTYFDEAPWPGARKPALFDLDEARAKVDEWYKPASWHEDDSEPRYQILEAPRSLRIKQWLCWAASPIVAAVFFLAMAAAVCVFWLLLWSFFKALVDVFFGGGFE